MGKIEQCLQELGYAIVPVQGTSMWPLLREKKSWVEVTIRDDTPLTSETVVLYRRENGQLVLHRIIRVENDGNYWVCGDHQWKLEERIREEQILAVARTFSRNGYLIDAHTKWYRLYQLFWNRNLMVRRCCLALLRLIGLEDW